MPGDGSAFIGVLLVASLVVAGAVAWQAQDAARSHRAMAERVLRDYAGLAAEELVRRSAAQIGNQGYYVLIQALSSATALALPAPPTPALLATVGDARVRHAAPLVRFSFRYRPIDADLEIGGAQPSPGVLDWLQAQLAQPDVYRQDGDSPMRFLHAVVDDTVVTAVFLPLPRDVVVDASALVIGFVVDRAGLAGGFGQVLESRPLLPSSLGDDGTQALTNDDLEIRIVDRAGQTVFLASAAPAIDPSATVDPYAPHLYAIRPFGDTYNGTLEGMTVRVAIDPSAAPKLVIGGLPRSRLPLLLTLFGLSTGLLGTAIFQLRRARKLTRLRSDFVSQVSHELRTPLTQIRMFAETLRLGRVRSGAETERSLGIIDREARRLGHLVENILQFSRGERGTFELARTVQPLAPLVRDVVEELGLLFQSRGTRVRVHFADGDVGLDGVEAAVDGEAFRQILLNLLDNAVKYGPDGQEIRIETSVPDASAVAATPQVRLTVDDQGPGVPHRDRERIWQSFRRLERENGVAGTGIGLAVVRELVELHGGRVWVEDAPSAAVAPGGSGTGSRFVVELPCESLQASPKAAVALVSPEPAS